MHGLEKASCPNGACSDFGKVNAGNVRFRGWYGKNKDKPLFYCRTCGKRFAATRGTPHFASHLPRETVHSIIDFISRGESIRGTSRLVGIPKDTVRLTADKLEAYCRSCFQEIMDTLDMEPEQMDKLWVFLKRLKGLKQGPRKGDALPDSGKEGQ